MEFVTGATRFLPSDPIALIVGCGDMGVGSARVIGRRHPLFLVEINQERLNTSIDVLRHDGYSVDGMQCDISDPVQVAELGARIGRTAGVKVLAHVAAIGNTGASWRKVLDVDLIGAQLVADAIGPHMLRGGVGIFISSTGAKSCPRDDRLYSPIDNPRQPGLVDRIRDLAGRELNFIEAYFIAKRGMNRLAERLAVEWGPRQVRALTVSPGLIDSTMGRTSGKVVTMTDDDGEVRFTTRDEKAKVEVPLGRQGSVLEVIAAIDFLTSDEASFINGIDLAVDGGANALARVDRVASPTLEREQLAPPPPEPS